MIEKVLSRSLRVMFAGSLAMGMHAATAQEAGEQPMQRVEITGSSIKRIAAEASLPVQSFNQKDIKKTGVTTVTDFIQQIPAMQGFTSAAQSVGGGGGGVTTASIHDIGEQYTLVLLNGRRIAPSNSGTTIDLNSIPLSAVERVEVLTDGASALYGADAIAGVVNFILKKGASDWQVDAKYNNPERSGGASNSISISKGFGDIDEDGYSLFFSASHDVQKSLKASQRNFAKSGFINFTDPATGKEMLFATGSTRALPANASVRYTGADGKAKAVNLNPYALSHNGACAPLNADLYGDGNCWFDSSSTIEINPETKRDGVFSSGELKLGNTGFRGFYDFAFTKANVRSAIAPFPAQFSIAKGSSLYNQHILPYLTAEQAAGVTAVNANYRLMEMGNRTYDYGTKATHIVAGVDGSAFGWDLNSAFTWSRNRQQQDYVSGFPLASKFGAAIDAGQLDPFSYGLGEMPEAMRNTLLGTGFSGKYQTQTVIMKGWDARGSREAFKLPGGTAMLGVGVDYRDTNYHVDAEKVAENIEILYDGGAVDSGYHRDNAGAYAELMMPLTKALEVTASARYDRIGAVKDNVGGKTYGDTESASTWKVSAKYSATKNLMFRAAAGTGFRAATMQQIAGVQEDWGVTAGTYGCPLVGTSHPLASYCNGIGRTQFEAFRAGNAELKPEKSKQWSIGTVWEPLNNVSLALDLWNVEIRDQVSDVAESRIFADPMTYANLFTTKYLNSTGSNELAIIYAPINIGKTENRGIDYDLTHKMNVWGGRLTSRLAGTYLLRSRYTEPGTDDVWTTSLNRYGSNDKVSFRHVIKASTSFETKQLTHTLTASYRNGYVDKAWTADDCTVTAVGSGECQAVTLDVPSYTTFDYQVAYRPLSNVEISAGFLNMFDRNPPLSLRNAGSHQMGYNPAYSSALGRQLYISGSYRF
ncbi:TonB-dependent receptor plug domain-containing protein [Pseudoduganella umbonata]|uniref:Iron complex outermembrane receptor protein n=1 Tax=Pseudoduganella umbonata TaxID=864828 RepID=A0A4P8HUK3_9BURK|nr:TonB-dependent receptor [Pseudoduganella umbonata]MBB3223543.1 iron complex outermembrane receptor protein [Pseudoduganella umbonata]QCP13583.1 TonB-dependent receptor [Pseudoduganella umbonata]